MIRRLFKRTVLPLWNQLYIDRRSGPDRTVFLAGTERSGTTWVADCINFRRDYRFLFEPFWPHRVPAAAPLAPQQYIRAGEGRKEQIGAAIRILSGRVRNRWVDQYHRRFIACRRLVKDVRSNLYLHWLRSLLPNMPIVLLIRHPCAVAKSQIERKHGFGTVEQTFLSQRTLVGDFLQPFATEIRSRHSPFEDRVFRWAIQNYVPLRQFGDSGVLVCFYEHLCTEPEREFKRIFDYLGRRFDSHVLDVAARPSPMSQAESPVNTGQSLLDSWRSSVADSDVSSAVDILKLFGLDRIYGKQSLPVTGGLERFWRS